MISDYILSAIIDRCERYADQPTHIRLSDLCRKVREYSDTLRSFRDEQFIDNGEFALAVDTLTELPVAPENCADHCMQAIAGHDDYYAGYGEMLFQIDLLRDIFGNPFRPVVFDLTWRTSTVVALAETMYASRNFDPMPILADALQDAGCDDEAILTHARGTGPHVRGCWLVDHILGKT